MVGFIFLGLCFLISIVLVKTRNSLFENKVLRGKAKVIRHNYRTGDHRRGTAFVELFDDTGKTLGIDYKLSGAFPNVGDEIDVLYAEHPTKKYVVRAEGYKNPTDKILIVLMVLSFAFGIILCVL